MRRQRAAFEKEFNPGHNEPGNTAGAPLPECLAVIPARGCNLQRLPQRARPGGEPVKLAG